MRTLLLCVFLMVTAGALSKDAVAKDAAYTIDTVAGTGSREMNGLSGTASNFAFGQPFGVEVGPDGALYITEVENHRVLRLDRKTGEIRTVAGSGEKGSSGDGGPATKAKLNEPYEVRFDRAGNMYFVEMRGAVVRRVDAKTGMISTIAGTGKHGFSGDGGPATKARLKQPHSIVLDGRGSLYIADIGNHRIRRVDLASGNIETIAGTGEKKGPVDGGVATGKPMTGPRALAITGSTLWIALREGHSVWSLNLESKRLRHIAGAGRKGYRDGPGKQALFNGPKGIVRGPNGLLFVVDTENQVIRSVDPKSGAVATIAGVGPMARGYGGDKGPARAAKMDRPHGIAVDKAGVIFIGDTNTHRVRRLRRK
ncbi:MAG: hypothetical protein AAF488_16305 [Planctomycetota bacterium]